VRWFISIFSFIGYQARILNVSSQPSSLDATGVFGLCHGSHFQRNIKKKVRSAADTNPQSLNLCCRQQPLLA
jgi:hypothetical protein